jgi:signal transduction histidine kinase
MIKHSSVEEPAPELRLAAIAHDFNNLLGAILGHALHVQSLSSPGDEIHESAVAIEKAAERGSVLAARLTSADAAPLVPVDIHELVREVIGLLRPMTPAVVAMESRLEASPSLVLGDAPLLVQMLVNLVINARDAMPSGGTLTFETSNAGGLFRLTVRDTGRGISSEMRALVFEPAVTTKADGKGMGLAVVRRVVQRHGGTVELESEPGRGAAFHIQLPLAG